MDSETRCVNSSKAQHDRAIGNIKRVSQIRKIKLRELAECVKTCGAIDVMMPVDLNESVC